MFNKDNRARVTQVKQGHVEYVGSLFGKDDVIFSINVSAMWDASKASFQNTVTLFEGKIEYISD